MFLKTGHEMVLRPIWGIIAVVQISFFPGVVVGVIIGYFLCSWLVMGKIE